MSTRSDGELDPDYCRGLTQFWEEQVPFNRWLGLRVVQIRRGEGILRLLPRPELMGNPLRKIYHGGVLASAADAAGGLAVMSACAPGTRTGTVDLRADYMRPVPMEPVQLTARVRRAGRTLAWADVTLRLEGDPEDLVLVRCCYALR